MEHFITDVVNPLVVALIGALITIGLAYSIRLINAKTGVEVSQETREKVEQSALTAALSVEEKAATAIKNGAVKWTSKIKLGKGINELLTLVPTITPEQAEIYIHAILAKIKGSGATDKKTFAVKPETSITITNTKT